VKATLARAKAEAAKEAALYRKRARPLHAAAAGGLVDDYRSDMLGPATLAAEGRFAPVAAGQGDMPLGFAGFEADADGRLRLIAGGQTFAWNKAQSGARCRLQWRADTPKG